jgi:hypothetical protein|tara:strand:- start:255 stop:491 length:237 start_codon:yes stop_codon:yes gene_type:complete
MNYSKWVEQFYQVLGKLDSNGNNHAKEASSDMFCWAQNACPNPEPDAEELARIYCSVMSCIESAELCDKQFFKDVYGI